MEVTMPLVKRESLDIESVLGDLHRKKRWLDTVIKSLEQALRSPEVRLVDAVQAAFEARQTAWVDLASDDESLLHALAVKVPRRGPAIEKRGASGQAAKSPGPVFTNQARSRSTSRPTG